MRTQLQTCPSCGMPAASGAVFCENCGMRLQEGRASFPAEPQGAGMGDPHVVSAPSSDPPANGRTDQRTNGPTDLLTWPQAISDSDAPFVFEWDCARQFLAGSGGAFAYRMRFVCNLDSVELSADIDGDPLPTTSFLYVQAGETREGTFPFTPKTPGTVTVNLRVKTTTGDRVGEIFEPKSPLTGMALSGQRVDVLGGAGTVNINAAGNTGINRFDGVDLGGLGGVKVDRWNDERSVFERPAEWRTVLFASREICGCEAVRLCAGNRTLEVVAGTDSVTFGRSSQHAAIHLVPEGADGQPDVCRGRFVSGVHFTFLKRGSSVLLRDGGQEEDSGRKGWRKSSNGLTLDGRMATSDQILSPGRTIRAVLAPYCVPGGAMAVTLEARGQDGFVSGCDRSCELAFVAVRREDAPNRAALVVWGAAEIGDLLGAGAGLRVGLVRGRLRLIRPDGSSVRLIHLVGGAVPGTGISVQ